MNAFKSKIKALQNLYDVELAKRLWQYIAPYKKIFIMTLILLPVISLLHLVQPYIIKVAIDDYILKADYFGLGVLALIFFLVLIAEFVVRYIQFTLMNYLGQKVIYDIRTALFSHLQEMSLTFYNRTPVGRLISRLTSDIETINELFTSGAIGMVGDIFTLSGIVVAMLLINVRLALVTLAFLPVLIVITAYFRRKMRDINRKIREIVARVSAFIQESITGIAIIRLFVQEKKKLSDFEGTNSELLESNHVSNIYDAVFFSAIELIGVIATALIVWYGGGKVIKGVITFGVLVAFFEYIHRFFIPIRDLGAKFTTIQSAMASSERLFSLLDEPPSIKKPDAKDFHCLKEKIEFKNVWFAYNHDDYVLKNLSFTVKKGEKVAIVGATGAGKTSIINLLNRLYDVKQGSICIDGTDIRDIDIEKLRKKTGVVLQDVFLFSGNIEDNISLRNNEISEKKLLETVEKVNAGVFINKLRAGMKEEIRERGSNLSMGERQLLAFARALVIDPDILILDEATSSVDSETEALIQQGLWELIRERTAIIIAHRLSTIKNVDRIFVIHKGEIREAGTHNELLKKRGIYYRLYQIEYKEQEGSAREEGAPSS
jgi:ATP-binding cassette, subfamily B, multidrug efflux pump